jgi:hypothetical protein
MAKLDIFLPLRPLVGLLSRIVRRELGLTQSRDIPVPGGIRDVKSVFSRSVAVALGQSFADGNFVRRDFAEQLRPRIARFSFDNITPPEAIDRAVGMMVTASEDPLAFGQRPVQLQIDDNFVAREAEHDYKRMDELRKESMDFSALGPLGPLWSGAPPPWWQVWPERPDRWVGPLGELCAPVWNSTDLPGESVAFLIDFGLSGIEENPDLIEPWAKTVSQLVATASKPKVNIREAVSCCRVHP